MECTPEERARVFSPSRSPSCCTDDVRRPKVQCQYQLSSASWILPGSRSRLEWYGGAVCSATWAGWQSAACVKGSYPYCAGRLRSRLISPNPEPVYCSIGIWEISGQQRPVQSPRPMGDSQKNVYHSHARARARNQRDGEQPARKIVLWDDCMGLAEMEMLEVRHRRGVCDMD
ncbi:hypothetical protein LZ30DRAFT_276792 [Colletotrichum cereale]|nr:hypothetical protein LZ30DRAFT_276792 [Colletotrichum cereale]